MTSNPVPELDPVAGDVAGEAERPTTLQRVKALWCQLLSGLG